ncbi:hypothetical protein JCM8097_004925 [Rhodosporidiobolus ruineniae]
MPSFAASRAVNPPGAEPTITKAQLWAGLGLKIREPTRFVPAITECRVEEDEGDRVVRYVRFGDGPEMREEVTLIPETIAYFEMFPASSSSSSSFSSSAPPAPSARITNLISHGPAPAHDLLLTFTFSSLPHVSDEEAKTLSDEELNERVGKGVEGTVEIIRALVKEGKL